jgi:transcriptional regulator with XRE-family HTH domain
MSLRDYAVPETGAGVGDAAVVKITAEKRALHRLEEVRRQQGVSRRTLARRLNTDVNEIKAEANQQSDLPLSRLYQWQEILEVPIADLLVDSEEPLSAPVLRRAQMVRLMKTASAILQRSQQLSIRRMAQVLVEQLIEMMPELAEVSPWHAVGKRRTQSETGRAAVRCIPTLMPRNDFDE